MKNHIKLYLAAHCFWDGMVRESPKPIIYNQYKVAVGKYTRDIKVLDNEFTEFFDVCYSFKTCVIYNIFILKIFLVTRNIPKTCIYWIQQIVC